MKIYEITAKYTDYRHPANRKVGFGSKFVDVAHTEYRRSSKDAKVEVFKYLLGKAELTNGTLAPDGKSHVIADFEVRNGGSWLTLSNKYYGRGDGISTSLDHYDIEIKEVDSLPDGETLKKGKFVFDTSYDNIQPARDLSTITDWEVSKVSRFPFKENFDLVKVDIVTPSGTETAQINCEVFDGVFRVRELQEYGVKVSDMLWKKIQAAFFAT